MAVISDLISSGSDSKNLCSEQHVVREMLSYTPAVYTLPRPNESLPYSPDYAAEPNPALLRVWGPNDVIWFDFQVALPVPQGQPQPEVMESLQRSLKENADVWTELSKY
jgi:hypothetical protein